MAAFEHVSSFRFDRQVAGIDDNGSAVRIRFAGRICSNSAQLLDESIHYLFFIFHYLFLLFWLIAVVA